MSRWQSGIFKAVKMSVVPVILAEFVAINPPEKYPLEISGRFWIFVLLTACVSKCNPKQKLPLFRGSFCFI